MYVWKKPDLLWFLKTLLLFREMSASKKWAVDRIKVANPVQSFGFVRL